jgi:hypothetical protein
MDDVKIETSKTLTLTLPSDPTSNVVSVSLYHEFGSLVSGPTNATRTGTGVFTITYGQQASGIYVLNAAGRYRADFTYAVSGTSYTQSQYFNVYTPYITSTEFFNDHPELEDDWTDKFDKLEKKVRNIINTFCGQSFEYYPNKYIEVMGSGKKSIHLPNPITTLRKVTADPGTNDEIVLHDYEDATMNHIEKIKEPHNFGSSYYVQFRKSVLDSVNVLLIVNKFNPQTVYKIEGDFGWRFVPNNIEQAADLLLEDMMNDDSIYRRHGIYSADMDVLKIQTGQNFYESTGNIDADILLMDYTLFVMDYVV